MAIDLSILEDLDSEFGTTSTISARSGPPPISDNLFKWSTKRLHNLFDLNAWEDTQLYGVLNTLGLLGTTETIAGGAIVRHLMKTDIFKGDIDIFPRTSGIAGDLIRNFKDEGYDLKKTKHSTTFELKVGFKKMNVQIVDSNVGTKNDIIAKFDFEHVRFAYVYNHFYSTVGAPVSIAQKRLHLRYVKDPTYSIIRALKYKRMGFDADDAIEKLAGMIKNDYSGAADEYTATNILDY